MRDPRKVLIVEDDEALLTQLVRGLQQYGLVGLPASTVGRARQLIDNIALDGCVADLRLPDGSGLDVIRAVRTSNREASILLMTGYGSLEIGAAAIRAGATHVISKPARIHHIVRRLGYSPTGCDDEANEIRTPTDERARWEHMQRVLADCQGNRSEAARRLGVDRGTLQRWLDRPAPR